MKGGRIKKQTSVRALVSTDRKSSESSKTFDVSDLPQYEADGLSFHEDKDGRLKVKRGTLPALCFLLLDPRGVDFDFETTFFLTFPLFLSSSYLLSFFAKWLGVDQQVLQSPSPLSSSLSSPHPSSLSSSSLSSRSDVVKEKARSSLSHWVHLVPDDFLDDKGKLLLSQVNTLVSSLSFSPLIPIPPSSSSSSSTLSPSLQYVGESSRVGGEGVNSPSLRINTESLTEMVRARKRSLTLKKKTKKEGDVIQRKGSVPCLPVHTLSSSLLLWPPLHIAQQLTALSWFWFEKISAREWLSSSWGDKEMDENLVPSIFNLIVEFNYTHLWAVTEILSLSEEAERTSVIEKMIDVLGECIGLQNYQTSLALFSALSATPVERLTRSWKGVSQKALKCFQSAADLLKMEGNFAALRSVIYSASPPLLPYIGIPMGDLTAIQQIQLVSDEQVVFDQCDVMGRVIAHIRHCQASPYPYKVTPEFVSLRGRRRVLDEKEAFALSQEREGGERKGGEGRGGDVKVIGSERRKSITSSSSLFSTSPARPSALKAILSDPSLGSGEGEGKEEEEWKRVCRDVFGRNPFASRFTEKQLDVLMTFLRGREEEEKSEQGGVDVLCFFTKERRREPTREEIEGIRRDLGGRGAGGVLLSTQIIMSWMSYE